LALRIAGIFWRFNHDWQVNKYLSQLQDRKRRLEILGQSRKDAELLEPDLLAAFELSYNALSEEERKLWRMLGVFPASLVASAAQLCGNWRMEVLQTTWFAKTISLIDFNRKYIKDGCLTLWQLMPSPR